MSDPAIGLAPAVLTFVVSVGAARGDAGLPILSSVEDENYPVMRFENVADYPDFDFYLEYRSGSSGAPAFRRTRVLPGQPVRPEGGRRRTGVVLLAVAKGQLPRAPERFTDPRDGALRSEALDGPFLGTGHLVTYRVRIENGKLIAAMQSSEWLVGEWCVFWLKRLPCIAVPIAFCAALGWLGARAARHLFPPAPRRGRGAESPS